MTSETHVETSMSQRIDDLALRARNLGTSLPRLVHDLRTPLNASALSVNLLEVMIQRTFVEGAGARERERMLELCRTIAQDVRRTFDATRDLLDRVHLAPPQESTFDLLDAAEAARELAWSMSTQRPRLVPRKVAGSRGACLHADHDRLVHALAFAFDTWSLDAMRPLELEVGKDEDGCRLTVRHPTLVDAESCGRHASGPNEFAWDVHESVIQDAGGRISVEQAGAVHQHVFHFAPS